MTVECPCYNPLIYVIQGSVLIDLKNVLDCILLFPLHVL